MSIVLAGLLITCSGMGVVAMVVFGVIPEGNKSLEYAFLAIGWIFIIIGMVIRWKGMKMEQALEEKKKQQK